MRYTFRFKILIDGEFTLELELNHQSNVTDFVPFSSRVKSPCILRPELRLQLLLVRPLLRTRTILQMM